MPADNTGPNPGATAPGSARASRHHGWVRRLGLTVAIAAVAAMLGGTLVACGNTGPRNLLDSIKSGEVTIGTKFDQPALGIREPDGSIVGFDPSVAEYVVNSIADELGVDPPEIRWRETPTAQRETLIGNGAVDMIAATYSINASRMERVNFAGPYLINYQGLLVREDDDSITSLTDLAAGKKLCSATGSTPAQNVKAQLPTVQLQEYDTYSSCVEALRNDKVDAVTTDEIILAGFSSFMPDEFKLVEMTYPQDACVKETLRRQGTPFSTEYYGIGMAQNYPEAVEAANRALDRMLESDPNDNGQSAWDRALRDAIEDDVVDEMIRRTEGDSVYKFEPTPGDLSFLDSSSTEC